MTVTAAIMFGALYAAIDFALDARAQRRFRAGGQAGFQPFNRRSWK